MAKNPPKLFQQYSFALMGSEGVGKTAFIGRFIPGSLQSDYDPTWEPCYRKQCTIDGEMSILELMEIERGTQEEYWAMWEQIIKSCNGIALLYSISNRESFEKTKESWTLIQQVKKNWIEELDAQEAKESARERERYASQHGGTRKPGRGWRDGKFRCVILVGNKSDIDSGSQRKVSKDDGEAMAKELGIGFRECSAWSGSGVEEVMFDLVRMVKNEVVIYNKAHDEKLALEEELRRKQERKKMGFWKRLITRKFDWK